MADEAVKPTVTLKTQVAKFDGEYTEGMEPVEIIETEETISLEEFLASGLVDSISLSEGFKNGDD